MGGGKGGQGRGCRQRCGVVHEFGRGKILAQQWVITGGTGLVVVQELECDMHGEETDVHNGELKEDGNSYYPEGDWYSQLDGQLSWFNAGVRVGVGISLGLCLGIGIGTSLLMRSYQASSRNFKRRFF
ncbi:hypothetical protein KSP40_PGU011186 [Platanthera guangdongensis]|uniref:Uncharacterized protein n=1 Tax=Platanthera guangdongensis TaxID=2320717 RepID=A0ABR2LMS5_9ASPA